MQEWAKSERETGEDERHSMKFLWGGIILLWLAVWLWIHFWKGLFWGSGQLKGRVALELHNLHHPDAANSPQNVFEPPPQKYKKCQLRFIQFDQCGIPHSRNTDLWSRWGWTRSSRETLFRDKGTGELIYAQYTPYHRRIKCETDEVAAFFSNWGIAFRLQSTGFIFYLFLLYYVLVV